MAHSFLGLAAFHAVYKPECKMHTTIVYAGVCLGRSTAQLGQQRGKRHSFGAHTLDLGAQVNGEPFHIQGVSEQ
jgi:hypothetical protein